MTWLLDHPWVLMGILLVVVPVVVLLSLLTWVMWIAVTVHLAQHLGWL